MQPVNLTTTGENRKVDGRGMGWCFLRQGRCDRLSRTFAAADPPPRAKGGFVDETGQAR